MRNDVPGIDARALDGWFAAHVPGAEPPLEFAVITGGHSNITYTVDDVAGHRYVLRRPPLGHVLATAHDMGREHRIISAVARTPVPVAPALAHCPDPEVNGAPFYVMGFVEGHVINSVADAEANLADHAARRRIGEQVADMLADLHAADVDAIGLGDLARRDGYLDRQLKRWRSQWESSKTRDLASMEEAYELLTTHKPPQRCTGVVHGDYRIGNMLSRVEGRVAAVLDWELCTLGDVLADLGYLLNNWAEPGEDMASFVDPPASAAGGFPGRDELVTRYAERSGYDVSGIEYYRAFSYWRSAAIVEGVKRRYLEGVMVDHSVDPAVYDRRVVVAADLALERMRSLTSGGRP
jgi:aminoglycoside phosphotransferase (APT) family kinase protein